MAIELATNVSLIWKKSFYVLDSFLKKRLSQRKLDPVQEAIIIQLPLMQCVRKMWTKINSVKWKGGLLTLFTSDGKYTSLFWEVHWMHWIKTFLNSKIFFENWDSLGQRRRRWPACPWRSQAQSSPERPWAWPRPVRWCQLPDGTPAHPVAARLREISPGPPPSQANQETDIFKTDASQRSLSH